jgi:hypothetical protein
LRQPDINTTTRIGGFYFPAQEPAMSSYVVNDPHISALMRFACVHNIRAFNHNQQLIYAPGIEQHACELLLAQNYRSVNHRYKQDREPRTIVYDTMAPLLTPVQALKACNCYAHQACETNDWERTNAYHLIERIKSKAIAMLPGYAEAAWHLSDWTAA